jgi:hypothetical protein
MGFQIILGVVIPGNPVRRVGISKAGKRSNPIKYALLRMSCEKHCPTWETEELTSVLFPLECDRIISH